MKHSLWKRTHCTFQEKIPKSWRSCLESALPIWRVLLLRCWPLILTSLPSRFHAILCLHLPFHCYFGYLRLCFHLQLRIRSGLLFSFSLRHHWQGMNLPSWDGRGNLNRPMRVLIWIGSTFLRWTLINGHAKQAAHTEWIWVGMVKKLRCACWALHRLLFGKHHHYNLLSFFLLQ